MASESVRFCEECGARNAAASQFCEQCGKRMPSAAEAVSASGPPAAPPPLPLSVTPDPATIAWVPSSPPAAPPSAPPAARSSTSSNPGTRNHCVGVFGTARGASSFSPSNPPAAGFRVRQRPRSHFRRLRRALLLPRLLHRRALSDLTVWSVSWAGAAWASCTWRCGTMGRSGRTSRSSCCCAKP